MEYILLILAGVALVGCVASCIYTQYIFYKMITSVYDEEEQSVDFSD